MEDRPCCGNTKYQDMEYSVQNIGQSMMPTMKKIIEKNPNITAKLLQKTIEDKMAIKVGIATIYRLIKSLGFSYITPRKYHYKQDKEEVAKFKKNLKGE